MSCRFDDRLDGLWLPLDTVGLFLRFFEFVLYILIGDTEDGASFSLYYEDFGNIPKMCLCVDCRVVVSKSRIINRWFILLSEYKSENT